MSTTTSPSLHPFTPHNIPQLKANTGAKPTVKHRQHTPKRGIPKDKWTPKRRISKPPTRKPR
eukprot:729530-Amorphochlora_amoeboformis.AAC.1